MCGIAGILNLEQNKPISRNLIESMCNSLKHRGPDDEGVFIDGNFGFGMRRLSIIDLRGGHQPIFNENKTLSIIFNGEIYNYFEIKKDLISKGHVFKTNSDTETILHCYEEYDLDFLTKLNGMFAIAIWDTQKRKLILARDRVGIKPLYYYLDKKKLIFGSEIKAIIKDDSLERRINYEALDLYLSFAYVPAPHSMFKNIFKLLPGHYLRVDDGRIEIKKYWDFNFEPNLNKNEIDFLEEFDELFENSVKLRMLSEVPLGAFLSGGIDSSSIVAKMSKLSNQPIKTFSIGFKDGGHHDETQYAEMVAKKFNTEHTSFKVDADIVNLLPQYINQFDEPFADYAALPTYVVSKLAKEFVTVVLTGDGGDEVFAGYKRHYAEKLAELYKYFPKFFRNNIIQGSLELGTQLFQPRNRLFDYFTFAQYKNKLINLNFEERYIESFYYNNYNYIEKDKLFKNEEIIPKDYALKEFKNYWVNKKYEDNLASQLYLDIKTSLPEQMLTKVDRVSMAVSLEARVPFLDHRIIEFAATIPSKYKISLFKTKKFLREAAINWIPKKIVNRPKHGFSSPIDSWFRNDLKHILKETLSSEIIRKRGIFRHEYVENMINEHLKGKSNKGNEIFMLMVFEMWCNQFLDR